MQKNTKTDRLLWQFMRVSIGALIMMFTLAGIAFSGVTKAQELMGRQVNLAVRDWEVEKVLKTLSGQTKVRFVYSYESIRADRKISINLSQERLENALKQLLGPLQISYEVVNGNTILLKRVSEKRGSSATGSDGTEQHAPLTGYAVVDKTIKGVVKDEKGEPMPGVSVVLRGTSSGMVTDVNGAYSLTLPDDASTLVFSYVGYMSKEEAIGNRTSINIEMVPDSKALEEVVVIGYGAVKRNNFTGSVGSVKLENSPVALMSNTNVLESLKGSVSGLNIGVTNAAGGSPGMLIRGQNSINGSNDPLVVLDGVIYLGSINDINPNDIATLDVLKDPTSAAAYGSRSANGVIAITTKKGKSGKPVITFNATTGFQKWQNRPEMMDGAQWYETVIARNRYQPGSTSWMKPTVLENYNAGKEVNWLDEVLRTGVMQNYQAAVSGSSEKVNYYLSTAFDDNKSIVKGDQFNRISLMGKVNTNITRWLEIGTDAGFTKRDYSGIGANINEALLMTPYGKMYRDDAGNREKYPTTESAINPLWGVNDGTRSNSDLQYNYRLNSHALVKIPFVKGLSYRVNYQINVVQGRGRNFNSERFYVQEGEGLARYAPATVQNFLSLANGNQSTATTSSYVFDNIVNYSNSFGKHDFDVTLVATRDKLDYYYSNMIGSNFAANGNTALEVNGLHKATVQRVDLDAYTRANIGYLGRLSYSFDDKYFFTGSVRRDGASVFGARRKWGTFSALGFAWKVTSEEFLRNFEQLSSLKVKFSWGQNGNQGVSPYGTLSKVANAASGGARYEFGNAPGVVNYGLFQNTLGNSELGWETTSAWNIGFESSWFKNRVAFDVDYYLSSTRDQIFVRNIPVMTGFKTIQTSMGQVNNRGLEMTLRTENIRDRNLRWNSVVTFWRNDNRLVHLYGEDLNGDGKEDDDISNSLFIGHSLGAIYGYKQDGIVQAGDTEYIKLTGAAPGAPKYVDLDGVPGITAADRTILGYAKENFRLNLSNTVSYKNFDLYVMIGGIFGGRNRYLKSNTPAFMTSGTGRAGDNMTYKPYWTAENPSNVYPSAYFSGDGRYQALQSRGFVRIQDVSLSYTVNPQLLKAYKIGSLKVFATAKNPARFTNWVGGDPEVGTRLRESVQTLSDMYPVASTYSLGVNLSF